jgi:hypothetical protein
MNYHYIFMKMSSPGKMFSQIGSFPPATYQISEKLNLPGSDFDRIYVDGISAAIGRMMSRMMAAVGEAA